MAEQDAPQIDFTIQKVFTQDLSFESPNTPLIFKSEWKPEANIDLNTAHQKLEGNSHEVTLTVTVTTKNDGKTAFVAEVKQSGIFTIDGVEAEHMDHLLGAFCPGILFPYAREAIANLIIRGGFPELNLAPINFDAIYAEQQAQAA